MLFKRNERSFKFCLKGLSRAENAEISKLITDNGGEISIDNDPFIITFTSGNTYTKNEVVFNVNYIRECVRQRKLLDLIKYKYGTPGLYGCLMSIFVYGDNSCLITSNSCLFCSTTQDNAINESSFINYNSLTQTEHDYAHGDYVEGRDTEACSTQQCPCHEEYMTESPEIIPCSLPRDSASQADEMLRDSVFLPDESLSATSCIVSDLDKSVDSTIEKREMMNFQEFDYEQNYYSTGESAIQDTNLRRASSSMSSLETVLIDKEDRGSNHDVIAIPGSSPYVNINDIFPLSAAEEETEATDNIPIIIESDDEIQSVTKLVDMRNLQTSSLSDGMLLEMDSKELEKQISRESRAVDDQDVDGCSRRTASPTILRYKDNNVNIPNSGIKESRAVDNQDVDGCSKKTASPTISRYNDKNVNILNSGIQEQLAMLENFSLTSTDSDETDYNSSSSIIECNRSKPVCNDSTMKLENTVDKKNASNTDENMPGPSRGRAVSEEREEIEVRNENIETGTRRNLTKKLVKKKLKPVDTKNTRTHSNDDWYTVVSSTKNSNDTARIDEVDSDSSVENNVVSSTSRKATATVNALPSTQSSRMNSKANSNSKNRNLVLSRNYAPWEQQEMVRYLINTNCIAYAKGYNVWKQMIEDGYLTHRTFSSLNNHFRKVILPSIHLFSMSHKNLRRFQNLQR